MNTETVDVKSKGETVDTIEVNVYDNVNEALEELGDKRCIELINRQNKADMTNAARAAKTRSASPITVLKRMADSDPEAKKKINDLLDALGISEQL